MPHTFFSCLPNTLLAAYVITVFNSVVNTPASMLAAWHGAIETSCPKTQGRLVTGVGIVIVDGVLIAFYRPSAPL